jgi:hypothetical protein
LQFLAWGSQAGANLLCLAERKKKSPEGRGVYVLGRRGHRLPRLKHQAAKFRPKPHKFSRSSTGRFEGAMTPTIAFSPSFNVLPRLCRVVHSVALGVANPEGLGRYSVGLKIKRRRTPQIQNLPGVVTEYWCTAMLHVGNRFDIDFHLVCFPTG